jgi:hypothetical protein
MADQIYSTIETNYNSQKTETIKGQAGKQIQISKISLAMMTTKAGVAGSVKVTATVNGTESLLHEFTEGSATDFKSQSVDITFLAASGVDVTLKWYFKTSVANTRIKANQLSYISSLVDIVLDANTTYMLSVKGLSKDAADSLAADLKTKYSEIQTFVEK